MKSHYVNHFWRNALFFLLLFAVGSCSKNQNPAVLLHVQGVSTDIKKLRVSALLDGKPAKDISDIVGDSAALATIGFDLPADARGMLTIKIQAIPDYQFVIADGQIVIPINNGGLTESTVILKRVEICSTDRWCWERPLPSGRPMTGLWGSGPSDMWAISTLGALFHFDGQLWTYVDTGISSDLRSIHGIGPNDIWVVGDDSTILHYDGTSWQRIADPANRRLRLYSVWTSGPGDVWIFGCETATEYTFSGTFYALHGTGSNWTTYAQADLQLTTRGFPTKIWGTGNTVYALGSYYNTTTGVYNAVLIRFQNGVWANISNALVGIPSVATCEDMTSSSPTDLWVLCSGVLNRGDASGATPTMTAQTIPKGAWKRMWVKDGGEAWMVGDPDETLVKAATNAVVHFTGGSWSIVPASGVPLAAEYNSVWGDSSGAVWVGGGYGLLRQFKQGSWVHHLPGNLQDIGDRLISVTSTSPQDVWAVADGKILHSDGSGWSATSSANFAGIRSLWAASPSDVWAVGEGGRTLHFDGSNWTSIPSVVSGILYTVWGTDGGNVWAAGAELGGTRIIRWNGQQWIKEPNPVGTVRTAIYRIFGTDKDHIWAIGGDDETPKRLLFLSYNGTEWIDQTQPMYDSGAAPAGQRPLTYLWASSPSSIWVGGYNLQGYLFFDGSAWKKITWFEGGPIWGLDKDRVLGFGRFDFTTRVTGSMSSSPGGRLAGVLTSYTAVVSVWGTSSGDIWAVGEGGTVLRRKP